MKQKTSPTITHVIQSPICSDLTVAPTGVQLQAEFIKFALWSVTARELREPKTQKDFAQSIGVCEDTLTDWKRNPQFYPMVQMQIRNELKERIPDVIEGLFNRIVEKGCAKEVEMFLRLAGADILQPNKIQSYGK